MGSAPQSPPGSGIEPAGHGARVLVVDDDALLRKTLELNLRARGYQPLLADAGEAALRVVAQQRPDVVVLDLGLPGMDGLDVITGIRGWSAVPIVVLSGRDTEAMKVQALDLGADDFVTKPFGMDEFFARVRAATRRSASIGPDQQAVVETDDFVIDFVARQVTRHTEPVRLTPRQWQMVEMLVRHEGQLVTYEDILHEVWGPRYHTETNYLRVFMAQIRQRLEPEPSRPRYFTTEAGMGFRFRR